MRKLFIRRRTSRELAQRTQPNIALASNESSVRLLNIFPKHPVPDFDFLTCLVNISSLISPKPKAHLLYPFRLQSVSRRVFTLKLPLKQSGIESHETTDSNGGQFPYVAANPALRCPR